jgi:vitamin B12 transporter
MVSNRFASPLVASLVTAASLACLALPARAADPDSVEVPSYRLDPVVVTAERMPIALRLVPSDVTVLDGAHLDRTRPLFAAEALRVVPGIDVQRAGRLGKITDVRLRGADPRHTLILFDGIPLNGPWVGSFDFADLGVAGLSQIEVMGGPASSLYGSGAVGGVIQLLGGGVPGAGGLRGFADVGGERTWRQGASFATRDDGRHLALSATRLASEGMGTRDAYRGWNGTTRAEASLDARTQLRLTGLLTHGVKELPYDYAYDFGDSRFHQVADPNYEERDRMVAGSALMTRAWGDHLSVDAEASGLEGRIVNDNPANAPGGDFQETRLANTRWIGSLRARATASRQVGAVAGVDYRSEHVNRDDDAQFGGYPDASFVDETIHSRAAYAQAHVAPLPRVIVDAGLRVEDHSRYGAYGVPRVAAAWNLPVGGLRVRGGFGRAFSAPTLTDLFYPFYGSTTLQPERSRTWEGGGDGRWLDGRLEAHVTWHETRFQNLIQSNSLFTADNVGSARIEGKEASLRLRPGAGLTIGARIAHLPVAKNLADGTGARLGKRPRWRSGADVEWEAARALRLSAAWRWSDSFRDPFNFVDVNGVYLGGDTRGYAALDLAAVVTPAHWPVGLRARVDNVLDREITEVKGLRARGRSVTLGIDVRP